MFLCLTFLLVRAEDLVLDCPSSVCPDYYIGDEYCDTGCMTPACNYDSITDSTDRLQIFEDSDCASDCSAVCPTFLLADGTCNPECNIAVCAWDLGDCGFCASGCSETDLLLDECKTECRTLECRFGLNTCGWCAEDCFHDDPGDGTCQEACRVEDCGYDEDDCETCNEGCDWDMLGDGYCDPECYTVACEKDRGDCECADGCTPELLTDSECQSECDNEECSWQNGACGSCASGCFESMIGDGECQEVCNTIECNYDNRDCGCAPGCEGDDLGSCKPECIVADCDYDLTCEELDADFDRLVAIVYHLLQGDFSLVYNFREMCEDPDFCTLSDLEDGYDLVCLSDRCGSDECLQQLGGCSSSGGGGGGGGPESDTNECILGCGRCSNADPEFCFECEEGYNQSGYCVDECETGYRAIEELSLCVPKIDSSTASNPDNYMVSVNAGPEEYLTIADALEEVWSNYATILLSVETHEFAGYYGANDFSGVHLTIQADCDPCSEYAVISLTDPKTQFPTSFQSITLENVEINARFAINEFCAASTCLYCPYYYEFGDGVFYDDRDELIENPDDYNTDACPVVDSLPFLDGNFDLTMTNCSVKEYRVGSTNFIDLNGGGSLTLENVDFENIQASASTVDTGPSVTSAVISYECTGDACGEGSVTYAGGRVKYLNNGYEYRDDISQFGFMFVSDAQTVEITGVTFEYNIILCGIDTSSCSHLLEFSKVDEIIIQDCVFEHSFTVDSTIYIDQQEYSLGAVTLDNSDNCVECEQLNVKVTGNTFTDIGSYTSIIEVTQRDYILNTEISHNMFSGCKSKSSMISLSSANGFSNTDLSGGTAVFTVGEDRLVAIVSPKLTIIEDLTFTQSISEYFLKIEKLPNVAIYTINIPAISENTALNSIISLYIEDEGTYMTLPIEDLEDLSQSSYVYVLSCSEVEISELTTETITCNDDKCLLRLELVSEDIAVSNIVASGINSTGTDAAAISLTGSGTARTTFTAVNMQDIISSGGSGAISISAVNDVTLNTIDLHEIEAYSTAGISVQQVQQVSATSLNFTQLSSSNGSGGALYFQFSGSQALNSLTIQSSTISYNSAALKGGGIYITADSGTQELNLSLEETVFEGNSAATGSIIVVSDAVTLSDESSILTCSFKANSASNSGGVVLNQLSGMLQVKDSNFTQNSGKGNSVYGGFTSDGFMAVLENVRFSENVGDGALYVTSTLESTSFNTTDCVFTGNSPSAVIVFTATWYDEASELSSNSVAFIFQISTSGYLTDTIISGNTAGSTGSVGQVVSSSSLRCTRCHFLDNSSELNGAALAIENYSVAFITDSEFLRGSTESKGSAISLNNNADVSSLLRTQFTSNSAQEGGTVNVVESSVQITDCDFTLNEASALSAGVMVNAGEAYFVGSTFHDQVSDYGVFIYATTQSVITVDSSTFERGTAQSGGAIVMTASELSMRDSSIKDCSSTSDSAGLIAFSSSDVTLTNCVLSNISSIDHSAAVYAEGGSLIIAGSTFADLPTGGLELSTVQTFSLASTTMTRIAGTEGAAIYSSNSVAFTITDSCEFSNVESEESGAVYLTSSIELDNTYEIQSSSFSENSAVTGAALHIDGVSVTVSENSFSSNTASDIGGAIFSTCPTSRHCSVNISSNTFNTNSASRNGGAIGWTVKEVALTNNTYQGNTAVYGNDFASFPISMRTASERRLEDSELASGQLVDPPIILALYDHYGHVVTTADGFQVQVSASGSNTSVAGETQVVSIAGIIEFANLNVTAEPTTTVSLSFYSATLESIENSDEDADIEGSVAYTFYSRECVVGEYYFNYECIVCDEGQYSLDPSIACADCPTGSECYGLYYMAPEAGYWRDNEFTDDIYLCYNEAACLGGVMNEGGEFKPTGECAEGYRGRLCQPCENGYSVTSKYQCGECPEHYVNALRLIGIGFLVVIVCFVMVRSSLRSAYQPKALHSVYIKILVNYLQLVMLTAQFRLDWPQAVIELLSVQEQSGQVTDQLFSFDCYLASDEEDSYKSVLYIKLIIMAFLPCLLAAAALVFWGAYAWCKKDKSVLKKELITTLCVLFFLIHPTITRLMFSMFSCIEIEGEFWLLENLDIKCWDEEHLQYSLLVALPSILIWVIGVPTLILVVIGRRKRMLMTTNERLRFGFLYNGYKLETYYWEFVILYRKIAIICCAVFLSAVSIPIQALICFSVLLFCLHMQYTIKPFDRKELNQMEVRAIIVASITIYCGLYYLTRDLDEFGKYFFFGLILLVNVYFLVFWLYYFCHAALVLASRFVPFLRDKVKEVQSDEKPLLSLLKVEPHITPESARDLLHDIQSPEDFYTHILASRLKADVTYFEDSVEDSSSEEHSD